jgi:(2R)-3-sulfolactate dehydrogenase (NADP+)
VKIRYDEALGLATDLLVRAGHDAGRAGAVARALCLAEVWELASHGLLRLPIYLDRLEAGGYVADAELTVVRDLGAMLVLDGGGGLGHWQLGEAVELAAPRAREFGIAAVAIGNSGHCGALGVFAADAAEAGLASLLFSCGPAALAPWGGKDRLLSSSPIAAGFPGSPRPAVVDLALSAVARGKIAAHANRDEPLSDGWALDAAGVPTNDPHAALAGLLAPLGGAKGFALAFMVEALTAALVGPLLSKDVPDMFTPDDLARPQRIAHLLILLDPGSTNASDDPDAAFRRLAELADATVEAGGRVPGARRMAPGEVTPDMLLDVPDRLMDDLVARRAAPGGDVSAQPGHPGV